MNFEILEDSKSQNNYMRDPPAPGGSIGRKNPNLAMTALLGDDDDDEEDEPPTSSRDLATLAEDGQKHARIVGSLNYHAAVCQSPEGSSGSSMDQNADNLEDLTPSDTPPPARSPGPAAAIGRLSLDNPRSDNSGRNHRGRNPAPGAHLKASKRAASSELPPRDNPPSPRQISTSRGHFDQNNAKGRNRHRVRSGINRLNENHVKVSGQAGKAIRNGIGTMHATARDYADRNNTRVVPEALSHGSHSRYPWHQDSGYDTMPSRQATLQQPLPKLAPFRGSHIDRSGPAHDGLPAPRLTSGNVPSTIEESKGVVTRLAGPVPVLIDSRYPKLIMQPESSPISQDQLAAEVKGIYGGLVMVEAKCINIDAAQAADPNSSLGPEQWQALIALHRTLLYEHHDFLMATQHPSATPALSGLAQKYSMPARMWRHGIHAFLEVLRHRRPQSQDYMLSFIYLAYQMMALLFETVPAFTDTWIECLGDLARYRMAIEEEKEAHSIWGGVAARWYNMASDRHPQIGRLYHHLGILERPSLRKMFMYAKSLTCEIPFPNARDSLGTLCAPIVQGQAASQVAIAPAESSLVTYYACLFNSDDATKRSDLSSEVLAELSNQSSSKLRDNGVPLLVTNIASLFELGSPSNHLWACFTQFINAEIQASRPSASVFPPLSASNASESDTWPVDGTAADESTYNFCYMCFQLMMHRGKDRQSLRDVLPLVHTILVWLYGVFMVQSTRNALDDTISSLFNKFPWGELCDFLNLLLQYERIKEWTSAQARSGTFPGSENNDDNRPFPLSEDHLIRGLIWCHAYFPQNWFSRQSEDDGRFFDTTEMHKTRVERVQWLALLLTSRTGYLRFDIAQQRFFVTNASRQSQDTNVEFLTQPMVSASGEEHPQERKMVSTPKSRSSTTISAHSDSEGYTIINTSKSKMSYAKAASGNPETVEIVDHDIAMEYDP